MSITINFYLNNDPKTSKSDKILFAYIRDGGKTFQIHTGERINPKYWDVKKQEAKKNYTGHPELNNFLISYKQEIQKTIRETRTTNPAATFEEIKKALTNRFKDKPMNKGFFEVYSMFLELRANELSKSMIAKYKVLRTHLQAFETKCNYKITFDSINQMFKDRFQNYLMTEKQHTNNTISKLFDLLRTFILWSAERDIIDTKDVKVFKTKTEKTDLIYLTEFELMKLYNLKIENKSYENVRDVFCFGCFTGQRFSDISGISRADIKDTDWHLRTAKTKDVLEVPLNEYAIEILNKYLGNSKPLPTISNQKTNQYLKEICKLAEINDSIIKIMYRGAERIETEYKKYDMVATHTARRTFITVSLEKGMRPETVMKITGHKDYKTFKIYIGLTSKVAKTEMNQTWNKEPLKIVNY